MQSLPITLAPTRTVSRGPLASPLRKTSSDTMLESTTIGVEALKLLHADDDSSPPVSVLIPSRFDFVADSSSLI